MSTDHDAAELESLKSLAAKTAAEARLLDAQSKEVSEAGAYARRADKARSVVAALSILGAFVIAGGSTLKAADVCNTLIGLAGDMSTDFIGIGEVSLLRLLLSNAGIYVGMALASLGFALFLIKAEGSLRAQAHSMPTGGPSSPSSVALDASAPGLVFVICATVVLYFSLTGIDVKGELTKQPASLAPAPAAPRAVEKLDPLPDLNPESQQ